VSIMVGENPTQLRMPWAPIVTLNGTRKESDKRRRRLMSLIGHPVPARHAALHSQPPDDEWYHLLCIAAKKFVCRSECTR
jgi:hypothetical protein